MSGGKHAKSHNGLTTGFVIATWNNHVILAQCLDYLSRQSRRDFCVCIVNNGLLEETSRVISRFSGSFEIDHVFNGCNLGFAKANNIGVRKLLDLYPSLQRIVFLNDDVELEPNWLEVMAARFESDPSLGLAQGANFATREMKLYDSTGIYIDQGLIPRQRAYLKSTAETHLTSIGPNAAAMMMTTECVRDLWMDKCVFDDLFFAYVEDVDLLMRAFARGWRHAFLPEARAVHLGSTTGNRVSKRKIYWSARNMVWMITKNFPLRVIFKCFKHIVFGHSDNIKYLIRVEPSMLGAYCSGSFVGLLTMPRMLLKRAMIARRRTVTNQDYLALLTKVNRPKRRFVFRIQPLLHMIAIIIWRPLPKAIKNCVRRFAGRPVKP